MTTDEKLAAILAAVQTDPGNRGLAELFAYCPGDFAAACCSIAEAHAPHVAMVTGFFIATATTPAFETDGPLGALFLQRALVAMNILTGIWAEYGVARSIWAAQKMCNIPLTNHKFERLTHLIAIERSGPAADGAHYSMRGKNITDHHNPNVLRVIVSLKECSQIGIGDGGNEIGMGKIPHETIVKNIPNGDLIHCRVPTDHLIVAGVSNWGAYALAAGVHVLRGARPPADLFDPDREREILEVMVREGPLVDGVTGKQTATVDGLSWDDYTKPMIRIREILES